MVNAHRVISQMVYTKPVFDAFVAPGLIPQISGQFAILLMDR